MTQSDGARAEPAALAADHAAGLQRAFLRLPFIVDIGARIARLGFGHAEVIVPFAPVIPGAVGVLQPTVLTVIAESAALIAVLASLPDGAACRVVEHKMDYTGRMTGQQVIVIARLLRPGGSLSVARVEVLAETGMEQHKLAVMQATFLHDGRGSA